MKQFCITEEKAQENRNAFFETNKKYQIFTDDLLQFLGEDFFNAPASNMLEYHNCFDGGLLDHLLRVTKYAYNINKILPDNLKQENESLIKVSLLSQIGKSKIFEKCLSDWHKKNQGKYYEFIKNVVSMTVGERSAYYATKFGVELKEYEFQTLMNLGKSDDDKMSKFYSDTLTVIIKQATELAIIEEKERWKSIQ